MIRADGSDDGIDSTDNRVVGYWDGANRELALAEAEARLHVTAAASRLNSGMVTGSGAHIVGPQQHGWGGDGFSVDRAEITINASNIDPTLMELLAGCPAPHRETWRTSRCTERCRWLDNLRELVHELVTRDFRASLWLGQSMLEAAEDPAALHENAHDTLEHNILSQSQRRRRQ